MSDRWPVHTLDPTGATDGQVPSYDAALGRAVWADGSTSGGGAVAVEDDGAEVVAAASRLNFTGAGVTVTDSGSGEVQVDVPGGGGGGGTAWSTALDLALTSLTGWGSNGGAWTADANGIHRTDTTSTARRYYTAATFPQSACVIECDVRLDSGAGNAGLSIRVPSDGGSNGLRVDLRGDGTNVTQIGLETDAYTALGTFALASSIPYGTWITLRLMVHGEWVAVFINGVFLTNLWFNDGNLARGPRIGLVGYAAAASWRNLTLWTPALP